MSARTAAILAAALVLAGPMLAAPAVAGPDTMPDDDARHRMMPDYDPLSGDSGTSVDTGRGAVFSTLANLIGRLFDGAKVKLGMDAPDPVPAAIEPAARSLQTLSLGTVSVDRLSITADPRAYLSNGLAADTSISLLGMDSRMGVQVGTERMQQSFALQMDCSKLWLPNDITSSFATDHTGPWTGEMRTSWGTACTEGQTGWRLTAGMRDLGDDTIGTVGLEFRPARWSLLAERAGLSSLRAGMAGERGQVGAVLEMWELRGQPIRLDAGFQWEDTGSSSVRLGTGMRF